MKTIVGAAALLALVACADEAAEAEPGADLDWVGAEESGSDGDDAGTGEGADDEGDGDEITDDPADEACEGATGLFVGDCAPDFTLTASNGGQVSLSDHIGGRVLVMGSATW